MTILLHPGPLAPGPARSSFRDYLDVQNELTVRAHCEALQ